MRCPATPFVGLGRPIRAYPRANRQRRWQVADETVVITWEKLAKFGDMLIALSQDVDKCTEYIKTIIDRPITPGSSEFAKTLKQRFKDRMDELDKAVADFQKALYYIGWKLK